MDAAGKVVGSRSSVLTQSNLKQDKLLSIGTLIGQFVNQAELGMIRASFSSLGRWQSFLR